MKEYKVSGHESSFLPDGPDFKLVWSDEFDGTKLDETKWSFRKCMMGKRHNAWTDKGVFLDGQSNAVFVPVIEDGFIRSSQLQTGSNFMDEPVIRTKFGIDDLQWPIGKLQQNKFTYRYGYVECRCRLQQKEGWWSAFWTQSPIIGASLDPKKTGSEVDIMESFHPGDVFPHNVFCGGYGQDCQHKVCGDHTFVKPEEFHRFGLLWTEDEYVFYLDGVERGRITENVSGSESFLLISTEIIGYRSDEHRASDLMKDALDDNFIVDYVRVFEISGGAR